MQYPSIKVLCSAISYLCLWFQPPCQKCAEHLVLCICALYRTSCSLSPRKLCLISFLKTLPNSENPQLLVSSQEPRQGNPGITANIVPPPYPSPPYQIENRDRVIQVSTSATPMMNPTSLSCVFSPPGSRARAYSSVFDCCAERCTRPGSCGSQCWDRQHGCCLD